MNSFYVNSSADNRSTSTQRRKDLHFKIQKQLDRSNLKYFSKVKQPHKSPTNELQGQESLETDLVDRMFIAPNPYNIIYYSNNKNPAAVSDLSTRQEQQASVN